MVLFFSSQVFLCAVFVCYWRMLLVLAVCLPCGVCCFLRGVFVYVVCPSHSHLLMLIVVNVLCCPTPDTHVTPPFPPLLSMRGAQAGSPPAFDCWCPGRRCVLRVCDLVLWSALCHAFRQYVHTWLSIVFSFTLNVHMTYLELT